MFKKDSESEIGIPRVFDTVCNDTTTASLYLLPLFDLRQGEAA